MGRGNESPYDQFEHHIHLLPTWQFVINRRQFFFMTELKIYPRFEVHISNSCSAFRDNYFEILVNMVA